MKLSVRMTGQPVAAANPIPAVPHLTTDPNLPSDPELTADPELPSDGAFKRADPAQGDAKIAWPGQTG